VKVLLLGGGFNLLVTYTKASYKLFRCIAEAVKCLNFSLLHQAVALLNVESNSVFSDSLNLFPITITVT
jgi:hypothetical protein